MSKLRDTIGNLAYNLGVAERLRRLSARSARFVLVMHGVASKYSLQIPRDLQPHHCASEMHAILTWIKDRYTLLTPDEFIKTNQAGILLTFDDGFANNYDVLLPILEAYAAPAILFITLQHVLKPSSWLPATSRIVAKGWASKAEVPEDIAREYYDGMTVEQLQACAQHPLITIGSHTVSHPFLSVCSDEEQQEEIAGSRKMLQQITQTKVEYFAYPTGDYDARAVAQVKAAGYRAAFAVDPILKQDFRFEIPRIGIYQADPAYLSMKLSGLHRRPIRNNMLLSGGSNG